MQPPGGGDTLYAGIGPEVEATADAELRVRPSEVHSEIVVSTIVLGAIRVDGNTTLDQLVSSAVEEKVIPSEVHVDISVDTIGLE